MRPQYAAHFCGQLAKFVSIENRFGGMSTPTAKRGANRGNQATVFAQEHMPTTTTTISMNAHNFAEHVQKDGIVLIDFWASWCGPCRTFGPTFEAAAARHPDLTWAKVDTEAEQDLAGALRIRSIPTLMIFRDGILVFSQAGALSAAALEGLVTNVRALDMVEVRKVAKSVPAKVA